MERWAFAMVALAIPEPRFWALSPKEFSMLREQWEFAQKANINQFAQLRADIHNGWMPREDKRPWSAEEFGAIVEQHTENPRTTMTPELLRAKVVSIFGPDGKGANKSSPTSAVAALKGTGQALPKRA